MWAFFPLGLRSRFHGPDVVGTLPAPRYVSVGDPTRGMRRWPIAAVLLRVDNPSSWTAGCSTEVSGVSQDLYIRSWMETA
jgi:hypothetical protein